MEGPKLISCSEYLLFIIQFEFYDMFWLNEGRGRLKIVNFGFFIYTILFFKSHITINNQKTKIITKFEKKFQSCFFKTSSGGGEIFTPLVAKISSSLASKPALEPFNP